MIYYKTEKDDRTAFELPNSEDYDLDDFTAGQCAEDYHANHDGWEATWPIQLWLAETEESTEWKQFVVEREYLAEFYAREIKEGQP